MKVRCMLQKFYFEDIRQESGLKTTEACVVEVDRNPWLQIISRALHEVTTSPSDSGGPLYTKEIRVSE